MDPKDILAVVLVLVGLAAVLWSFLSRKTTAPDDVRFFPPTATQFSVDAGGNAYTFADGFLLNLGEGTRCHIDGDGVVGWVTSNSMLSPGELMLRAGFDVVRMLTESGTDLYILAHGDKHATLDSSSSDGLKWVLADPALDVDPRTLPVVFPTVLDVPSYVSKENVTYAVRLVGSDPARYALISPDSGCLPTGLFPEFGLTNGLLYPVTETRWYFVVRNSTMHFVDEDGSTIDYNSIIPTETIGELSARKRVFDVYKKDDDDDNYVVGIRDDDAETSTYYELDEDAYRTLQPKIHESVMNTARLQTLLDGNENFNEKRIADAIQSYKDAQ